MIRKSAWQASIALMLAGLTTTAPAEESKPAAEGVETVQAATDAYNRIVLPEAYEQIVIPPDAPLADEPIPLDQHRGLLLRPREGAEKAIPVFVQLKSGESFTVRLKPDDEADPAVYRYRDAPDVSEQPSKARPDDQWISETMIAAFEGERPDGFEATDPPAGGRLVLGNGEGALELAPVEAWRGSQHRLSVYRLSSDRLVNVEPRDFYREGVVAVSVEGDVASTRHHPRLFVLEVDDG